MAVIANAASIEVDPISRIEGHLGVKLTTGADGKVSEANVHGNLWRGFENFLLGREANDAITFVQRICGVCPVPHGQTSTYAVDAVLGYSEGHITFKSDGSYGIPLKAIHIRNLVLSAEFLMSHLTHFYHLVALDYVQGPATPPWTPFFADNFYHPYLQNPALGSGYAGAAPGTHSGALPEATAGFSSSLWDAAVTQYVKALRIRRLTFEAGALFAGRMPMTSCFVGGGVTYDGTEALATRCAKYKTIMQEVGEFIIKEHVPLVLALGALYPNYDNLTNAAWLDTNANAIWEAGNQDPAGNTTAAAAGNTGWGAGVGNFLAWGAFPQSNDTLGLPGGFKSVSTPAMNFTVVNKAEVKSKFITATATTSVPQNLKESIAKARYGISDIDADLGSIDAVTGLGYPGDVQRTMPNRAKAGAYTYIKAPRWGGKPAEVGPFARMVVAGFYSVSGGSLATGFAGTSLDAGGAISGYDAYVKLTPAGNPGLNPAMLGADLAVALVREGLATVTIEGGTPGTDVVSADPITDFVSNSTASVTGAAALWVYNLKGGMSVMDRLRGRALEALYLVQKMIGKYTPGAPAGLGTWGTQGWIDELAVAGGGTWADSLHPPTTARTNWGGNEAPRGALMHFCSINTTGNITAYQCIVPTTWNASPKDAAGQRGPMEQSMMYIPFQDWASDPAGINTTHSGLEALRVAHTFDPCIACAIH